MLEKEIKQSESAKVNVIVKENQAEQESRLVMVIAKDLLTLVRNHEQEIKTHEIYLRKSG